MQSKRDDHTDGVGCIRLVLEMATHVCSRRWKDREREKRREKTLIKMPSSVRHIVQRNQYSNKKMDAQPLLNAEIFDLQRKKLFNLQ